MDVSRGGSFAVMQIRPLRRRGKAPISPFVDRRNNYLSAPDNLGASHRLDPENNCAVDCLPSLIGPQASISTIERLLPMATGTVKWFNATKGFGFIQPDQGGPDAFVHISAVERAGMNSLNEGQKVEYELVSDRRSGKMSADNLKAVG